MPRLFTVSGYIVYFWSNENGEPIHVHISKGKPSPNGTKIFRKNGRIYQVGFDINSELAFDWLIPEKQYDYVIQKRREQYEKANQ